MTEQSEPSGARSSTNATDQPCKEHLIAEYQAAQDSAHHHDNLVWSVTSVMWGGSLVLMGFILSALKESTARVLVTGLCLLGMALTIGVWIFAVKLAAIKRHKYKRCKEIEIVLHLRQHTSLAYSAGSGRVIYGVLMAFFLAAWGVMLCTIWCGNAG